MSDAEALPARLTRALLGPCSSARLRWFRKASALTLLLYTLTWSTAAGEWLTDAGYHLSAEASGGLQLPIPLLGRWGMVVFLTTYVGALLAVLFDARPRLASVVVFGCLFYATTVDRLAAFSMNKLALVAWLVLLLAPWPAEAVGTPDSEGTDTPADGATAPQLRSAWPIRVLQGTLILQYFGAGICKLRGGWAGDHEVLWLQIQSIYMTDFAAWTVRSLPSPVWAGLHYGALAFELLAPLLFIVSRLRPLAFVWGLTMHLAIGLMMHRVGLFSLSVVAYYPLFVHEEQLRELYGRVFRRS